MDFVMGLCHRIMVMVEGRVMAVGTPAEIRGQQTGAGRLPGKLTDHANDISLHRVRQRGRRLWRLHDPEQAELQGRRGKITLLLGPNGAGKSTVLKTLFGMLKVRQGRVRLDGQDITGTSRQATC